VARNLKPARLVVALAQGEVPALGTLNGRKKRLPLLFFLPIDRASLIGVRLVQRTLGSQSTSKPSSKTQTLNQALGNNAQHDRRSCELRS